MKVAAEVEGMKMYLNMIEEVVVVHPYLVIRP